jgi:hypothetical protein
MRVGRERPTRLFIDGGCRNIDPDALGASLRSLALSRVLASTEFGSRPKRPQAAFTRGCSLALSALGSQRRAECGAREQSG